MKRAAPVHRQSGQIIEPATGVRHVVQALTGVTEDRVPLWWPIGAARLAAPFSSAGRRAPPTA